MPKATQDWEVRIVLNETEGENTTCPWYTRADIVQLVRSALDRSVPWRDLKIQSVNANPGGPVHD
jgi:hypothetical protein